MPPGAVDGSTVADPLAACHGRLYRTPDLSRGTAYLPGSLVYGDCSNSACSEQGGFPACRVSGAVTEAMHKLIHKFSSSWRSALMCSFPSLLANLFACEVFEIFD